MTREPFRARLRDPKDELWLGCRIRSKRGWTNRNGDPGITIGFDNCPLFANFSRRDFEISGRIPMIGDVVNVEFKWRRSKSIPSQLFPTGRLVL